MQRPFRKMEQNARKARMAAAENAERGAGHDGGVSQETPRWDLLASSRNMVQSQETKRAVQGLWVGGGLEVRTHRMASAFVEDHASYGVGSSLRP